MDVEKLQSAEQKLSDYVMEAITEGKMMYWNDRESILRNIGDHPLYGPAVLELLKDDMIWDEAMQIVKCTFSERNYKATISALVGIGIGRGLVIVVKGAYYLELHPAPPKNQSL